MSDHHEDRLDGWKAIADFLTRDERTVQRWAKERGLAVHRVPGGKGASVFAYRAELEQWLDGAQETARVAPAVPPRVHGTPVVDVSDAAGNPAIPQSPWRRWIVVAGLVVSASLLVGTIAILRAPVTVPDTLNLIGNAIVARAEARLLWRYSLNRPDGQSPDAIWYASQTSLRVVDLDDDGIPEVLALLKLLRADQRFVRAELFCLSASGELLWSYTPQASFTFGEQTYDGPWRIEGWISTEGPGGPYVWLNVIHEPWWPSFVIGINAAGQAETRFVHPGHIYSLATVSSDEGNYVLAAGVNNEHASAMLAVVAEMGRPAVPPASDPRFVCRDCPQGSPSRYMLFPRSELNSLLGHPYNLVYGMEATPTGIQVSVQEVNDPHLRAVYQLSGDLTPESVGLSDTYWETHRRLEREGQIRHSVQQCPERREGMKVRIWEPERGWWEETVKVVGG